MSDRPSDRPRRSSRRRDQQRNKATITSEDPHKHNGKPPFAASSEGKDTKQVNSASDSGRKNRVDPLPHHTANDAPVAQRGKGDTVEDEVKPDVAEGRKPSRVRRRKGTPTPSLQRADAQKNDPTTAQRITRLPQRPRSQPPAAAQRHQEVSASVQRCRGKKHRTGNDRSQAGRAPNRKRGQSASSAGIRRGRSPAPVRDDKRRDESRGRSRRRSKSPGDRNRSLTRSQSVKRALKRMLSGKNERDESESRVITRGESIIFWEDESKFASVQVTLDSIRSGTYDEENIIYLRVSVVVSRGNIGNIKNLFIKLQMRCPCCKEQWRLARYSPRTCLGYGTTVDCKDTRGDETGGEIGGSGGGGQVKVTKNRRKEQERQYTHADHYELEVTQTNNVLRPQLRRVGDTVETRPPSHFKVQTIAAPPCDSNEMHITGDIVLNGKEAPGSWRPVPLEGLDDSYNFDNWRGKDWKRNGGCDSFETK